MSGTRVGQLGERDTNPLPVVHGFTGDRVSRLHSRLIKSNQGRLLQSPFPLFALRLSASRSGFPFPHSLLPWESVSGASFSWSKTRPQDFYYFFLVEKIISRPDIFNLFFLGRETLYRARPKLRLISLMLGLFPNVILTSLSTYEPSIFLVWKRVL